MCRDRRAATLPQWPRYRATWPTMRCWTPTLWASPCLARPALPDPRPRRPLSDAELRRFLAQLNERFHFAPALLQRRIRQTSPRHVMSMDFELRNANGTDWRTATSSSRRVASARRPWACQSRGTTRWRGLSTSRHPASVPSRRRRGRHPGLYLSLVLVGLRVGTSGRLWGRPSVSGTSGSARQASCLCIFLSWTSRTSSSLPWTP